jgi:hypothetical protein
MLKRFKFPINTPLTEEGERVVFSHAECCSMDLDYAIATISREAHIAKENHYQAMRGWGQNSNNNTN